MKISKFPLKFSKEDSTQFFGFENFEDKAGDFVFVPARVNFSGFDSPEYKSKKIVYFELEEPNRFCASDPVFRRDNYSDEHFYKIFSACPYTTEWLNRKQGNNKRTHVFVPFNEKYIPTKTEKIYDVIYVGGIHSTFMLNIVKTISKFNYRYISMSERPTYKIWRNVKFVRKISSFFPDLKPKYITNQNVPYFDKLKIVSQTRISIVHTLLNVNAVSVRNIQRTDGWSENKAFSAIPQKNLWNTIGNYLFQREYQIPQQKGRLFETALCRSLMLCRKDTFGEIERYFEVDKEFIYYEEGQLEEKIREILTNWGKYEGIIENAFQRASREYTTGSFVEKYLATIT